LLSAAAAEGVLAKTRPEASVKEVEAKEPQFWLSILFFEDTMPLFACRSAPFQLDSFGNQSVNLGRR